MANIVVLTGPTAIGKTWCISQLADRFCSVLYADTACMYKDLSIGVAKPSVEDLKSLPHHFVNNLELDENFNVGKFFEESEKLCQHLENETKPILLSGGSIFYIHSFLFGPSKIPPIDDKIRGYWKIELQNYKNHPEKLHDFLKKIDAVTANRVHPHDTYRIIRALEVYTQTQKTMSEFTRPSKLRTKHNWLIIELYRHRQEIYQRIKDRLDIMWKQGLQNEIDELVISKKVTIDTPAMKAIGYKEFFQNLRQNDNEKVKNLIEINTKHYAKRQITFLKRLPIMYKIYANDDQKINKIIQNWLNSICV